MIYAIGDIHGDLAALQGILEVVRADAGANGIERPKTVFLGDYVDRGPDSKGVLDLLSSSALKRSFDPVFLMGNHDRAMLTVLRGADPDEWCDHGGLETMRSYVPETDATYTLWYQAFIEAVPTDHYDFLEDLESRHRHGPWAFSHAGMDPGLPFDEQRDNSVIRGCSAFLSHTGPLPGGIRLVHGHWARPLVEVLPHRVNVDTGCGMGGVLSAVALDDDGGGVRVLGEVPVFTTDASV